MTTITKPEVGEIDTRAPFQSVKDAVSLFGESSFSGQNRAVKKVQHHSADRVLAKGTHFHCAQNELNKLKEELKNAESTKAQALVELEKTRRTVDELTYKLSSLTESKESLVKATEAANNRANEGGGLAWKEDLEIVREEYKNVISELDAAKKELRRFREHSDACLESKMAALKKALEADKEVKANKERASELSKEISAVKESIEQVSLASSHAKEKQEEIFSKKGILKQYYKKTLKDSESKLRALEKEFDHELVTNLETQLAQTMNQIESLQKEMENARASDLDSVKTVTLELDDAKSTLQRVAEEESSLRNSLDRLKLELENVKKEHDLMKEKEAETESIAGNLHFKLRKSKSELEMYLLEESKARGAYEEMISTLNQLSYEMANARREAEEMKNKSKELKREVEVTKAELEEAEKNLTIAMAEAEESKTAEARALDQMKAFSETTNAARALISKSNSKIMISSEEFESFNRKVEESDLVMEMKVEAANAQVEAVKASENEVLRKLEMSRKEIKEIKLATEEAVNRAEMAEAAKKAVEGELKRWRELEWKKAASHASEGMEMSSVVQKKIPEVKVIEGRKLEKGKFLSKKILLLNLRGVFHRKKKWVAGRSVSYLPSEEPI